MPANGQFPASALAPIAGGSVLAKQDYRSPSAAGPAAAWNAMAAYIFEKERVRIAVTGPDSAYRTLERQKYYWALYQSGQGNQAAYPGTSNHGMGINVDVPQYVRALIDKYGAQFGWSKSWSDAPAEWWHITYQAGHYTGPDPGPGYVVKERYPVLKKGDDGEAVKRAQRQLARWNLGITRPKPDGDYGPTTVKAVREFQEVAGLGSDGVIGKKTWLHLRREDHFTQKERTNINRFELVRGGKLKADDDAVLEMRKFFARAAIALEKNKKAPHRNERHDKLRTLAGEELYQQIKKEKD